MLVVPEFGRDVAVRQRCRCPGTRRRAPARRTTGISATSESPRARVAAAPTRPSTSNAGSRTTPVPASWPERRPYARARPRTHWPSRAGTLVAVQAGTLGDVHPRRRIPSHGQVVPDQPTPNLTEPTHVAGPPSRHPPPDHPGPGGRVRHAHGRRRDRGLLARRRPRPRRSRSSCPRAAARSSCRIVMARLTAPILRDVAAPRGTSAPGCIDLYGQAREDSLLDALTGLGNHRAFQEELSRQLEHATRHELDPRPAARRRRRPQEGQRRARPRRTATSCCRPRAHRR